VLGDKLPVTENGKVLTVIVPKGHPIESMSDVLGHWNIGSLVAMKKYPSGIELSKIATTFTVSYALGMLVRYYPSHWVGMLHNQRHDVALPSLMAALQQVETDFPRFVVEFLERRPSPRPPQSNSNQTQS
jgi:hypothetical protein